MAIERCLLLSIPGACGQAGEGPWCKHSPMPPTTPPTIAPTGTEEEDEGSPAEDAVSSSGGAGGAEAAGPSAAGGCEAASGTVGSWIMLLGGEGMPGGVGITAAIGGSRFIIIGGWGPSLGGDGGCGRAGQVGELM